MKYVLRCLCGLMGWLLGGAALAQSVVFINPGKSDEIYWVTASRAMEAAAKSLGLQYEVQFAERNHLRVLEFAREISTRPSGKRPDYAIFSNDYGTGPELLRMFDAAGIKTLMAFSGITAPSERALTGRPRERYKTWLGSIEPRAEDAGYLTAQTLIAKGRAAKAHGTDGKLHVLAISGDRSTPVSVRRGEGMRRAVAEAPDAVVDQEVFAAWSRDKAAEQAEVLFQRYPQARLIWTGSDQMAFGAMQVWEKRGGTAGKDGWFSAVNTSREALDAVKSGRLSALAGGHFIAGAWAIVLIHDHAKGRDFVDEGLEMDQFMFTLFTPDEADLFLTRFGDMDFKSINFNRYSKVQNPKLKRYDFNFRQLLR